MKIITTFALAAICAVSLFADTQLDAHKLRGQKKYAEAASKYMQAAKETGMLDERASMYALAAECARAAKNNELAHKAYSAIIQDTDMLPSSQYEACVKNSELYRSEKKYTEAIASLRRIRTIPDLSAGGKLGMLRSMSRLYQSLNKKDEALSTLREVLKFNPAVDEISPEQLNQAYSELMSLLVSMKRGQEAQEVLKKQIQLPGLTEVQRANLFERAGNIELSQGDIQSAINYYKQSLASEDLSGEQLIRKQRLIANAYLLLGKRDEAKKYIDAIDYTDGKFDGHQRKEAYKGKVGLLARSGDFITACREIDKMASIQYIDGYDFAYLAKLRIEIGSRTGNVAQAATDLELLMRANKDKFKKEDSSMVWNAIIEASRPQANVALIPIYKKMSFATSLSANDRVRALSAISSIYAVTGKKRDAYDGYEVALTTDDLTDMGKAAVYCSYIGAASRYEDYAKLDEIAKRIATLKDAGARATAAMRFADEMNKGFFGPCEYSRNFFQKAIDTMKAVGNPDDIEKTDLRSVFYFQFGELYVKAGFTEDAIEMFQKARDVKNGRGDIRNRAEWTIKNLTGKR